MKGGSLYEEACAFIRACYGELGKTDAEIDNRLLAIRQQVEQNGGYEHTSEELEHGAKMAWRNSNRCIGRLFWHTLQVFDERAARTEEAVLDSLFRHIAYATNDGKIRPAITVFKPVENGRQQVRIWNYQLIRYAGYDTENGVVGDPHSLAFTNICRQFGWEGEQTPFDILPLVIQIGDRQPQWFDIPKAIVKEVPIRHPEIARPFEEERIKWYAVPFVADMRLEIGGISYTAAPFNGWYMATEIGARNLADESRYNLLPKVAAGMGLNTDSNAAFWKDRALVELNAAVYDSFKQSGVSIVDHHTAAQQFQLFEQQERQCDRRVTGDWTWLIPPLSPATTHIFHQHYDNTWHTPNFFYQEKPY